MSSQAIDLGMLGDLARIGQGGQGVVYLAPNGRTRFAESIVYKEYRSRTLAEVNFSALAMMPALVEESLSYEDAERLISIAAWPCAIVEAKGNPSGFVMPAIPHRFFLPITTVKGVEQSPAELQHLLNNQDFVAARGIDLSEQNRYSILREVATALAFLHRHGICVGDISPKNLLFSLIPASAVYFVDCDAMRVNGVSALPQVETPGWEIPAGEELATVYSDTYKLGLLAVRLLVGDQDISDPQQLPTTTPKLLRRIITDTLEGQPQARPLPQAWTYILDDIVADPKSAGSPGQKSTSRPRPKEPQPRMRSRPSSNGSASRRPPTQAAWSSVQKTPKGIGSVFNTGLTPNQRIGVWGVGAVLLLVVLGVISGLINRMNHRDDSVASYSSSVSSTTRAYNTPTWTTTTEWSTATTTQRLRQYAAIAVSPSTLAWGSSWNSPDQEEAKSRAVGQCEIYASDCEAIAWSADGGCVALAGDTNTMTYSAWYGTTKGEAETEALMRIRSSNGEILTSVCNS